MKIECRAGTPHEMESVVYARPSPAKAFVKRRVKARERWAARYNLTLEARLRSIREEIDSVDIARWNLGSKRRWSAVDEHTHVEFVFEMTKLEE